MDINTIVTAAEQAVKTFIVTVRQVNYFMYEVKAVDEEQAEELVLDEGDEVDCDTIESEIVEIVEGEGEGEGEGEEEAEGEGG